MEVCKINMQIDRRCDAVREICNHFELGEPQGDMLSVSGGLLHRMWRVRTTLGQYALKVLNPEVIARPGVKDVYRMSERIARAAADAGIPAAVAMTVGGDPLFDFDGSTVMLFEWVHGTTLPKGAHSRQHARLIGALLFGIHRLAFQDMQAPLWKVFPHSHWESLVARGRRDGLIWAAEAEAHLTDLLRWSGRFEHASSVLAGHLVTGHGDLNPKNVLWKGGNIPVIIDWESAGLTNPAMELIDSALSWSGQETGSPDRESFAAFIQSYREAGGTVQTGIEDALYGRIGSMLEWLEYNMRRSLDKDIFGEAEQHLGVEQVLLTFAQLKEAEANIEVWSEWAQHAMA